MPVTHTPVIDAIVLAAGASTRFGSDKRLTLIEGEPMLQRTLACLVPAIRRVIVVLREEDSAQLSALLGEWQVHSAVQYLLLNGPERGMGSNLARAVMHLPADSAGVMVALGDMPYIQLETLQALLAVFQSGKIIFPLCAGKQGHPVLFARSHYASLAALSGQGGARSILEARTADWVPVRVYDPGVIRDIDSPEDLHQQS